MSLGRRVRVKTDEEVELIRLSSLLVGRTLAQVAARVEPGVTTLDLDAVAEEFIRDHGAEPGFKGYGGFPNSLCTSVNEAVVHGIPNDTPLQNGDIVSVDCGVLMNGFYGDSAYTFEWGEVSPEVHDLLEATKKCLDLAIEQLWSASASATLDLPVSSTRKPRLRGGSRVGGHGLGKDLHEAPEVPNYGRRGNGPKLMDGMVLAIEPMINLGTREVGQAEDGWTIVTRDGAVSAHFEHDIVVRQGKADVLSSFKDIEEILNSKNELS